MEKLTDLFSQVWIEGLYFFAMGGAHSFDTFYVTVFDLFIPQSEISLCTQGKGLIIIKSSCVLLLLLPAAWWRQYIDSWKRSHCFKFMYTAHTKRSGREDVVIKQTEKRRYPRDSFRFALGSSVPIRQTFAHVSFTFVDETTGRRLKIWTLRLENKKPKHEF